MINVNSFGFFALVVLAGLAIPMIMVFIDGAREQRRKRLQGSLANDR